MAEMKDPYQGHWLMFLGAVCYCYSEAKFCLGSILAPGPQPNIHFSFVSFLHNLWVLPQGPPLLPADLALFQVGRPLLSHSWMAALTCLHPGSQYSNITAQINMSVLSRVTAQDLAIGPAVPEKGLNSNHRRKGMTLHWHGFCCFP